MSAAIYVAQSILFLGKGFFRVFVNYLVYEIIKYYVRRNQNEDLFVFKKNHQRVFMISI